MFFEKRIQSTKVHCFPFKAFKFMNCCLNKYLYATFPSSIDRQDKKQCQNIQIFDRPNRQPKFYGSANTQNKNTISSRVSWSGVINNGTVTFRIVNETENDIDLLRRILK